MLLEVFKINVFYACTRQPLAGTRRIAASITFIYIYIFVFVFFLNIYFKFIFFFLSCIFLCQSFLFILFLRVLYPHECSYYMYVYSCIHLKLYCSFDIATVIMSRLFYYKYVMSITAKSCYSVIIKLIKQGIYSKLLMYI